MTQDRLTGEPPWDRLKADYPALDLRLGCMPPVSLRALGNADEPAWNELLSWQELIAPGIGPRAAASLFLGQLAFFTCLVLAAPLLTGQAAADPDPDQFGIELLPVRRLSADAGFDGTEGSIRIWAGNGGAGGESLEAALRRLLEGPVQALARRSGLRRSALWRVAGDGAAAALLDLGRRWNRLPHARRLFEEGLKQIGSPLLNRQLTWPEDARSGILQRGGCCRIYEVGLPVCAGCVLVRRRASSRQGAG